MDSILNMDDMKPCSEQKSEFNFWIFGKNLILLWARFNMIYLFKKTFLFAHATNKKNLRIVCVPTCNV